MIRSILGLIVALYFRWPLLFEMFNGANASGHRLPTRDKLLSRVRPPFFLIWKRLFALTGKELNRAFDRRETHLFRKTQVKRFPCPQLFSSLSPPTPTHPIQSKSLSGYYRTRSGITPAKMWTFRYVAVTNEVFRMEVGVLNLG